MARGCLPSGQWIAERENSFSERTKTQKLQLAQCLLTIALVRILAVCAAAPAAPIAFLETLRVRARTQLDWRNHASRMKRC